MRKDMFGQSTNTGKIVILFIGKKMLKFIRYLLVLVLVTGFNNFLLAADQTKHETSAKLSTNQSKIPKSRSFANRALNVGAGVRLALFCESGVNGSCFGKNVSSISIPSPGVNCIRPSSSARLGNAKDIIPAISVEWGESSADASDALFAYYYKGGLDCPYGTIEVVTYDGNYGNAVLSDGVAFTLIVP